MGPCPTVRTLGRSRNAVRVFSRCAIPRTLKQRSLRQALQVESSYLLCSRPTSLLAYIRSCGVPTNLSRQSNGTAVLIIAKGCVVVGF